MFGFHLEFTDGRNPYFKRCKSKREVMRELKKWRYKYDIAGHYGRLGIFFGTATVKHAEFNLEF